MKIEQSKLVSAILIAITILYIFGLVLMESYRGFFSQILVDPNFVTLEMIAFTGAIAFVLILLMVRSFHVVIVEPDRIRLLRTLSRVDLSEDNIAWISSGQGWLYLETNTGRHYSFKILFSHRNLNARAVEDLAQSVANLKSKIQARFPEHLSTLSLKGIFSRIPIFFLVVVFIGLLPVGFSIVQATISPTDAIIASIILILAAALGLAIPIFMIGPLFAIELERNSISLKYLLKKVKLSISDIKSSSQWYDEGQMTTNDGRKFRLGGLTTIGQEKLSLIGSQWYKR